VDPLHRDSGAGIALRQILTKSPARGRHESKTMHENQNRGTLYLCATPIGNLEDITLRALGILREADLIAAENRERARKLLSHYDIHHPIVSYREENRDRQGASLIESLLSGKNVALISDAGMPGLSDPGVHLVRLCHSHDIPVLCAPGPSAILTSLVISGFTPVPFIFLGFLPRKKKKREELLSSLAKEKRTIIIFEAPHRLLDTLAELRDHMRGRSLCINRELTKKFEESIRGDCDSLMEKFSQSAVQGEITIVIEGYQGNDEPGADEPSAMEHLERLLDRGCRLKDAAREVAQAYHLSARDVYRQGLAAGHSRAPESEKNNE
jgi:16S rRNA (cytidine1402-2'-O)-methyltransferase